MTETRMNAEEFRKRLAAICLRRTSPGMPRRRADQHVVYKAVSLALPAGRTLAENEVNDAIESWLAEVGRCLETDHVTLRRLLVDAGYLERTADGAAYRRTQPTWTPLAFDAEVDAVAQREVVEEAEREAHERRARHLPPS